jgi:hypothetical protein
MAKACASLAISHWGTPDPRDATAYPKATSETPMTQWGWEFLRRHDKYRERWQELVQPFMRDDDRWDFEAEDRERQAKSILYVSPLGSIRGEFSITPSFGNFFLDPRSGRAPVFDHCAVEFFGLNPTMFKLPQMSFVFDVRSPLDPQLENARQKLTDGASKYSQSNEHELARVGRLTAFAAVSPRPLGLPPPAHKLHKHIEKYPTYLRLLDFKEIRASNKEIGEYLFRNKFDDELRGMISKSWKAARICQRNYLSIAISSPLPSIRVQRP